MIENKYSLEGTGKYSKADWDDDYVLEYTRTIGLCGFLYLFVLQDRVSLSRPGWP